MRDRRCVASILALGLWLASAPRLLSGEVATAPPLTADHTVELPAGQPRGELVVQAAKAGPATVLVRGLALGGAVQIAVGGKPAERVELLATKGLEQGRADAALVTAPLTAGPNPLVVTESPGAQVVRVAGTNLWFATTSEAKGRPLFSVDLDQLKRNDVEYPVTVYYGLEGKPFCWFSGKFDRYHGDSYTQELRDVAGSSGPQEATLAYTAHHPPRNLVMPMRITLVRDLSGSLVTLRVQQTLRATGEPSWGDNLEFLHLVINPKYGLDWEDGVPDFVWYRAQRDDAPDTLPGSRTTMIRMDDNTRRSYPYPSSTADPKQIARSGAHHTGAAVAMEATNTVGGWFTKSGVGCIGLAFHECKTTFRSDLTPLHSHCGDGADTHFYLLWGGLYTPLGMKAGDAVDIAYSLTMLPSEPLHTDIEDLNEADLFVFGDAKQQRSPIVGWLGTKQALGLVRGDGSVILLGLGTQPGRVKLPEATGPQAKRAFRVFDLGRPQYEKAAIAEGAIEVRPRSVTVIDCGSALNGPEK
jgi:hypothetical protein